MATSATPNQKLAAWGASGSAASATPGEIATAVFLPLASLKLTVSLLAIAAIEVLLGTLAQDKLDMWEVMSEYFRAWITWVELRMLFPDSWFPSRPFANSSLGFPFPGGLLIGTLMALNLIAAHTLRFRIQASGSRFWVGLGVLTIGALLTTVVILSGHSGEGEQGVAMFQWTTLWQWFKLGVLAATAAAGTWLTMLLLRKEIDRGLAMIAGLLTASLLVTCGILFLGGESLYLGDSGMRILWQLLQGTLAGLVLLVGCLLIFKKRAGIVLIHTGILLMMGYELFVGTYAIEEQMVIREGEATNQVSDIRDVELAVIDNSDDEEQRATVIPVSTMGMPTRFLRDKNIKHEDLPFDIEIVDYYKNTRNAEKLRKLKDDEERLPTKGFGRVYQVEKKRPVTGADGDEVNYASLFVKLTDKKTNRDLGVYLVSQIYPFYGYTESVNVGDKTYDLELRFKSVEKPYTIQADDVRREDYVGTTTPKDFSSFITLTDANRDVKIEKRIWMNNPMRYSGETFYQSGYNEHDGVAITTLQVVTNTGWMAPYVGCMIVATGLLAHFFGTLVRFLNRVASGRMTPSADGTWTANPVGRGPANAPAAPLLTPAAGRERGWLANWGIPLAVVALTLFLLVFAARREPAPADGMNLAEFGRMPVVYQGRTKPYDTLARNCLRVISGRETFTDQSGEKQPAIRWLLDVISNSEQAKAHQVFRIYSLDVLQSLKLEPRPRYRYAYNEFKPRLDEIEKQVDNALKTDKENLNNYQRALIELNVKLRLFDHLRYSHQLPSEDLKPLDQVNMFWRSARMMQGQVPFGAPTTEKKMPWEPLSAATLRNWIPDLMEATGTTNEQQLAVYLAREAMLDEDNDELSRLIEQEKFRAFRDFADRQLGNLTDEELDKFAEDTLRNLSADKEEELNQFAKQQLQESLAVSVFSGINSIRQVVGNEAEMHPVAEALAGVIAAYRQDNAEQFNRHLAQYRAAIADQPPFELSQAKVDIEAENNRLEVFYKTTYLYFFVGVLTCFGWLTALIGWSRPLNRTALLLGILAFTIHTLALVARVYISGRPPVTNLYSSAIFIGWVCVGSGLLIEMMFRLGIGNIVASIAGFSTLIIAQALAGDGDTMKVLQAVLDTTFWLSTHVVCITVGYAATFLAGIVGTIYVLLGVATRLLSRPLGQLTVGKVLASMVYGITCFAIFFSFVGTVLGGLWADDSWGRFWGWDPKENGALIIVLWNALVLHARWGGMVRDRGLAVLALGGNIVTSWSWFGVNQLGIGLHSYGFTEGILLALGLYVVSQLAFIGLGLLPLGVWRSFQNRDPIEPAET